jgi:hypothetical protein
MLYVRKPLMIQAIQWGNNKDEIADFLGNDRVAESSLPGAINVFEEKTRSWIPALPTDMICIGIHGTVFILEQNSFFMEYDTV